MIDSVLHIWETQSQGYIILKASLLNKVFSQLDPVFELEMSFFWEFVDIERFVFLPVQWPWGQIGADDGQRL